MRIREIYFNNFRCFRGEHRISFVDPVTDQVRPVTVLSGSNGTGKTTILEAVEGFLNLLIDFSHPSDLVVEAWQTGLVYVIVEILPDDVINTSEQFLNNTSKQIIHIVAGKQDLLPPIATEKSDFLVVFAGQEDSTFQAYKENSLQLAIANKYQRDVDTYGGLLYFPHNRQLTITRGGSIEPPPPESKALLRFSRLDNWQGSLEQFWVWQNYLDLEQGVKNRKNLKPFVGSVENVLGPNRKITIKDGRVTVPPSWSDNGERNRLRLDQLPSGEQQILLLFGELARRRRKGAIIAIDEIENSLHPTLQRLAMWNLRKIAREWDSQIIVTTHSLEVINTVRGGAFINLDYPENNFDLPVPDEVDEDLAA